ncbi:MAG TPA: hypothetical protein VG168_02875 [Bryobacteraceae bacterium]|jgi:hypothetical protein|nr:hypothetical protein [Bryobacteraceae bacterium]
MKNAIRVVVTPVPVCLPFPLIGAIPIDICVVASLPIDPPGTLFVFIEIVVVFVVTIVYVVTVVVVIVSVVIVVLRH